MALAYDASRVTRDVDARFLPHGIVMEEARRVADALGLPPWWLNEHSPRQTQTYISTWSFSWAQLGSNQRPLACKDCHHHSPACGKSHHPRSHVAGPSTTKLEGAWPSKTRSHSGSHFMITDAASASGYTERPFTHQDERLPADTPLLAA